MIVTSLVDQFYYLGSAEYPLPPGGSVTIPDHIALGDERVRSAIARLYLAAKISATPPPSVPVSGSPIEFPAHVFRAADADEAGDVAGPTLDLGPDGPRVLTDMALSIEDSDLAGLDHFQVLVQSAPTDPATDASPVFAPSSLAEDDGNGASITPVPLVVNRYVRLAIGWFQASDLPAHPDAFVTVSARFQAR